MLINSCSSLVSPTAHLSCREGYTHVRDGQNRVFKDLFLEFADRGIYSVTAIFREVVSVVNTAAVVSDYKEIKLSLTSARDACAMRSNTVSKRTTF